MIKLQQKIGLSKILLLAGILFLFFCREKPKTYSGYSKQSDFYYKLVSLGDGVKKTDTTQYLWVNASFKTLTDSVFWDTKHNSNQAFFITKNSPIFLRHIYGYAVGDSLAYLFPTNRLFKELFNSSVPFFCEKDYMKFLIRLLLLLCRPMRKKYLMK